MRGDLKCLQPCLPSFSMALAVGDTRTLAVYVYKNQGIALELIEKTKLITPKNKKSKKTGGLQSF